MKTFELKLNKGFTLIEVIIYTGIFSLVSLVVIVFISQVLGVTESSRRTREALDNARVVLDTIAQEIRTSESVYTSTSTFGSSQGQLSLETTRDTPDGDNTTYVDIYLDNQGVFMKREGESAQLLTSEKVKVTNLTFTNLDGGSGREAVRASITVVYDETTATNTPNHSVTLVTTAAPRDY